MTQDTNKDILSGETIALRAPEPADIDLLYHWENDTRIWRVSNTLTPYSRFQIEEYIMNTRQDIYAARQLRLMIDLKNGLRNGATIGAIDLFDFDPVHLRAGVGILIQEEYRGNGYAREALGMLIRYAFTMLRLHQLYCNIAESNVSSRALFEGVGFVTCGVKKAWLNEGGTWQNEWMFQLISSDDQLL